VIGVGSPERQAQRREERMILRIVSAPFRLVGQLLTGIGRVLTGRS
jgi:hypothetical protein